MRENIVKFERKTDKSTEEVYDFGGPGANDSDFNPNDYVIEEPVVYEEAVKKPVITRKDLTPEAIYNKRIEIGNEELNIKDPILPDNNLGEITETIIVDNKLPKTPVVIEQDFPRLTRYDFTPQGIAEAKEKAEKAKNNTRPSEVIPDSEKISNNLRVQPTMTRKSDFAPTSPNPFSQPVQPKESNTGIPETSYKIKMPPTPAKKSFFSRFVPKFISRFF